MNFAQQLINWRRELHQYPELSLQEFETSRRVRHWLENAGLRLLPTSLPTGLILFVFLPLLLPTRRQRK